MTAAGDRHMARVRELGCILCGAPASIHHINAHGMGMKASDFEVLPLCFQHHQAGGMGGGRPRRQADLGGHPRDRARAPREGSAKTCYGTERAASMNNFKMLHSQLASGDEDPTLEHGGIPCPTQSSTSLPTSQPSNTPSLPPMATIPSGTNLLSPSDGSSLPSGSDQPETLDCGDDCPGCIVCHAPEVRL